MIVKSLKNWSYVNCLKIEHFVCNKSKIEFKSEFMKLSQTEKLVWESKSRSKLNNWYQNEIEEIDIFKKSN